MSAATTASTRTVNSPSATRARSSSPAVTSSGDADHRRRRPAGAPRTPAPAWPRATARPRARGCARAPSRPGPGGGRAPGASGRSSASTSSARSSTIRCGRSIQGRAERAGETPLLPVDAAPVRRGRAPGRAAAVPAPAPRRRPARPSSPRRSAWRPAGRPPGRAAARPARARSRRRPAYGTRPTARTNCSSENGSRSSTLPPPRATMITSTSGSASSSSHRLDDLRHRVHALHRHVAHLEAHRGPAPPRVLQDVPLGRRGAPARPARSSCGRKGSGRLRSSGEEPLRAPGSASTAPAGRAVRRCRPGLSPPPAATAGRAARTTPAWRAPRPARPRRPRRRPRRRPGGSRSRPRRCRARGRAASGTPRPRRAAARAG